MLKQRGIPASRIRKLTAGRRWLVSSSLAIIAVLVLVSGSFAGGWCRADPIVEVDGEVIQIWVAVPDHLQHAVNGPVQVKVSRPWNAKARVLLLDAGFNGHGEKVSFFASNGRNPNGSLTVDVMVVVPIDKAKLPAGTWEVPVMLEIITDEGTTIVYGSHWWTSTKVNIDG